MDRALARNRDEGPVSRATCREIVLDAGVVPEWIELLPAGEVDGFDGRKFVNDNPQAIIERFRADPHDIPLDWEHSTEIKGPEGEEAPAAGWIVDMSDRGGQVWGKVDWNSRGRDSVSSREYRYVSPAILFTKDRSIRGIASVALTNNPNLDLPSLNRGDKNPSTEKAMLKKLLALLAQKEITTEEQALEYVDKAVKSVVALQSKTKKLTGDLETSQTANTELAEKLKTSEETGVELNSKIEKAELSAKTPDLALYVPRSELEVARNRVDDLQKKIDDGKAEQLKTDIDTAIEEAKKAGKITPATEGFYRASCAQDGGLDRFREFAELAAPIIPDPKVPKKPDDNPAMALSDEELAVCAMSGGDPARMALFKKDPGAWAKQEKADRNS